MSDSIKPHKREGCSELSSDNIINAGGETLIHIACLFLAIIVHGAVPDSFGICSIVPIPKGIYYVYILLCPIAQTFALLL